MVRADVEYAIAEGRALAESLMLDSCTIARLGELVTDPVTHVATPSSEQVYPDPEWPIRHPWKHGPCKVQTWQSQESNPEAGGATFTVQRYRVDVPVGSFVPQIGDVVMIATAALDPHLVGRKYRVVALLHKTMSTAYRLGVDEDLGEANDG